MELDIQSGRLILSSSNPPRTYQQRQFAFYGGKQINPTTFEFKDATADKINSLLAFFESEGIEPSLSEQVQEIVEASDDELARHGAGVNRAKDFKEGLFDATDYKAHLEFLNKHIKRQLLDHQQKASYHLGLVKNGANFSVPGSGKTTVLLSYYEKLRTQGEVDVIFVIGPPACFGPWRDEFEEVLGRKPHEQLFAGGKQLERRSAYILRSKQTELLLTTFQTLQNDYDAVRKMFEQMHGRVLLVVDEAHYMKQLDGKWAGAVLAIASAANYRCVLTGTPIPHSYKDLFNMFAFLWQEHSPLTASDHAKLSVYEKERDFERAAALLNPKLGPLFYRVRKKDLNLKPQMMRKVNIKMNPVEHKIYQTVIGNIRTLTTQDYLRQAEVIADLRKGRVMRLRQSVSFPKLLSSAITSYGEDLFSSDDDISRLISKYSELETPAKIAKMLELVNDIIEDGKKVVIWSNFLGTVDLIMQTLDTAGIRAKKIVGQTPIEKEGLDIEETREKIREEFVDVTSGLDVLVANPAACAESISLHKTCHNAIYYDLSFNCAQFLQSLDRIHRVGGSEHHSSYYDFLMYEDTVDKKIYDSLIDKSERMKALIDHDYSIYSLDMVESGEDIELEDIIS